MRHLEFVYISETSWWCTLFHDWETHGEDAYCPKRRYIVIRGGSRP